MQLCIIDEIEHLFAPEKEGRGASGAPMFSDDKLGEVASFGFAWVHSGLPLAHRKWLISQMRVLVVPFEEAWLLNDNVRADLVVI